jgi:hypothetical protein
MRSICYHLGASLGLLLLLTTPVIAAPTVPTCDAVGRIISANHNVVTSVDDRTTKVQDLLSKGTAPIGVLRACFFNVPGAKFPFHVTFYSRMTVQFLDNLVKLADQHGNHPQKLSDSAYGDFAVLSPKGHEAYTVMSVVDDVGLEVNAWTDAENVKNIAKQIVKLL